MDKKDQIISKARELCEKFITKVDSGRARSKETYAECKALLKLIESNSPSASINCDNRLCGKCSDFDNCPGYNM